METRLLYGSELRSKVDMNLNLVPVERVRGGNHRSRGTSDGYFVKTKYILDFSSSSSDFLFPFFKIACSLKCPEW